jgi:isopenicillin-N N-acyltransferase-like protein
VLRDEGIGYLIHTNHCVHPELQTNNDLYQELIESHPRKCRLEALFGDRSGPFSAGDAQRMLADHDHHPRSICRHENDDPRHGLWATVFSIVMQPTAGRMYVTRGTPCDHPFETYMLNQ